MPEQKQTRANINAMYEPSKGVQVTTHFDGSPAIVAQVANTGAIPPYLPAAALQRYTPTVSVEGPASPEQCKLVDCNVTSPTHADGLDSPKLDFGEFQTRIKQLADEFYCANDVSGMVSSIIDLDCEAYHDELTALLLRASLDRKDAERDAVVKLLGALHAKQLLSATQIVRAFEKLVIGWKDVALDVPDAPEHIMQLLSSNWSSVGMLDQGLALRLPEDLLRAFSASLAPGAGRDALLAYVDKLSAFKIDVGAQLEKDLFGNESVAHFGIWLKQQDQVAFHHEVLVQACLASLNTSTLVEAEQRRHLVLTMLEQFHTADENWLLDEVALQLGFSRLLGKVGDIIDEQPYCREMLVSLLRGSVEKELLPAEFLKSARRMRFGGPLGVEVVKEVQRLTPMHSRRIWGDGDARQFRVEIRQAILEYFDSKSIDELAQIAQELHLNENEQAHFMRKLMSTGMERKESPAVALDAMEALVGVCWFQKEVREAFVQLRESYSDLALDVPNCVERTDELVSMAIERNLLHKTDTALDRIPDV